MGYTIPTNVPGARSPNGRGNEPPAVVGLLPKEAWPTGEPAAMVSDSTIRRNYDGKVLRDLYAEGAKPLSIGGALTSDDVLRQSNGAPLVAQWDGNFDPGVDDQGRPPGEQPRDVVYVAGQMPREPVYDSAVHGGWGTPVTTANGQGYPSSWSRRDDRWVWADGRITDAQGTVLGHWTGSMDDAAREIAGRGPTPSITWIAGAQVIASPNAGGGTTMQAETDAGFDPRPILLDSTPKTADPIVDDPQFPAPVTVAVNGGPAPDAPPVNVTKTPALGLDPGAAAVNGPPVAGAGLPAGFLMQSTLGIPNWAWLAAAAVLVLRKGGR